MVMVPNLETNVHGYCSYYVNCSKQSIYLEGGRWPALLLNSSPRHDGATAARNKLQPMATKYGTVMTFNTWLLPWL